MVELTQQEALSFIRDILEVKVDDGFRFERGQRALDFLNSLIEAFLQKEPFQGVTLLATEVSQRRRPTWQEIKADMFSRLGGICYELNGFFFSLLRFLGYDACLAHATCTISEVVVPQTHVLPYVQDVVIGGDRYLVDVGVGEATFQAIDLNFETESPVFDQCGTRYKYVKHEGKLLRMHDEGRQPKEQLPLDFFIGTFKRFYWAETESFADLSVFFPVYDSAYSQVDELGFHKILYLCYFPNKRKVLMKRNLLCLETEPGVMRETKAANDDEVVAFAMRHIPQLGEEVFRKALANMWAHKTSRNKRK